MKEEPMWTWKVEMAMYRSLWIGLLLLLLIFAYIIWRSKKD